MSNARFAVSVMWSSMAAAQFYWLLGALAKNDRLLVATHFFGIFLALLCGIRWAVKP